MLVITEKIYRIKAVREELQVKVVELLKAKPSTWQLHP